MWKRLIAGLTLIAIAGNATPGQTPDGYDTCYTRGQRMVLIPKYDTIKQLEKLDDKTDTLIETLRSIAEKLNINDSIE